MLQGRFSRTCFTLPKLRFTLRSKRKGEEPRKSPLKERQGEKDVETAQASKTACAEDNA